VGQKVRSDTKCSRRLEDFLQLPSKASTNLGASHRVKLQSDSNLEGLGYLLTVKQVAKIYGQCDDSTVWRWVKQGILPKPVKVGGRTLWRESEIQNSIREA